MRNFKMIGLPLIAPVLWVVSGRNPFNPEASQKIDLAGLAQTSANGECSIDGLFGSTFTVPAIGHVHKGEVHLLPLFIKLFKK